MASDIVIRASADERIKSVVAISPYSTGITPEFPKDLLLISGQFENHLRSHALKMVKTFRPDAEENTEYADERTRRKASYIKNTGHVSVIYAPQTTKIIIDWLKLEDYDRPFWKTHIGWILIGMTFIVIGMSRLNNNLANETILVLAKKRALSIVVVATLVSLSSGLIEINLLSIYGFERIAIYFGLIGLFAFLFSFRYQSTEFKIDLLLWLKLILCFGVLCFLINRYIGSFTLSGNRITAFITLILPITLFCLVIEKLIASSSIWKFYLIERNTNCWFFNSFNYFPRKVWFNVHNSFNLYSLLHCFWLPRETSEKKIGYFKVGLTHGIFLSFAFAATNPIFAL